MYVRRRPAACGQPPGLLDLALVHAVMHDVIQAIQGKYEPYLATPTATGHESKDDKD